MCGRFKLLSFEDLIAGVVDVVETGVAVPRYNIAPTQDVPAVRIGAGRKRCLTALRWGLLPPWAKDRKFGARMINARSETVHEKPAFREALRRRRCLILADGFYEWKREGKARMPYCFARRDGAGFFMAGIWERCLPVDGPAIESCAILTTEARGVVAGIHDRMPVIVPADLLSLWLDGETTRREALEPVLSSTVAGELRAWPVSAHVNNPRHDDPRCVQPRESMPGAD